MKIIKKYKVPLWHKFTLELKKSAQILYYGYDDNEETLWVSELSQEHLTEPRHFKRVGFDSRHTEVQGGDIFIGVVNHSADLKGFLFEELNE